MLVDVRDDRKVRGDDAPQLVRHALQLARHRPLDVGQRHRSDLLTHVTSPWRAPAPGRRRPCSGYPRRTPGRTGPAPPPFFPAPPAPGTASTGRADALAASTRPAAASAAG